MYYGYSSYPIKSPPPQASCWEKIMYPSRRVRHLLLIAALGTVVSMVIINISVSSLDANFLSNRISSLKPYASNQYSTFRQCNHCSVFNLSFVITNQDFCSTTDDIYLLIIVLSHPNNAEQRNAIRNTWGSVREHEGKLVKTVFLLGMNEAEKSLYAGVPNIPYISVKVNAEANQYGDIIVVNMADHYTWLTNKTIAGLSWASSYCNRAHYVLKTDDDCFNNPYRYVEFLSASWLPDEFVGGCCFTGLPNQDQLSRWHTDPNEFPDIYFPVYCGGPAYVIPLRAVDCLLNAAQNVPYFTMEDIFVTGFCREAADIPYVQIPGVNAPRDEIEDCDLALWVAHVHRVSAAEMRHMWTASQDRSTCYSPQAGFATVVCLFFFIAFWAYVLSRILGNANKIHIKNYFCTLF